MERYTFVIYDKTSYSDSINEARRELFCQMNKTMEQIQPTEESQLQQSKRVAYQSGIWATCELAHQPTPSPEGCGWTLDGDSNVMRPLCRWLRKPALNWASAAAAHVQVVVVEGGCARRHIRNAQSLAVVNVTDNFIIHECWN